MFESHAAQDLSDAALGGSISIQDGHFVDGYGRTVSLRGYNVSGASKLPIEPSGLTHLTDGFYEHRTVTFIGRPFPIEEAPLHFRRLQAWGLPFIRLLITWESIGHAGPNPNTDLDLEYIAYLRSLMQLMPSYGIKCFICAHQDVWSRFSGGSGAPGWTFEAAGLHIEAFTDTGAAYVHGQDELRRMKAPINEKEPSGPFVWPSGYQKLAASTMATLFWAGDALAPKLRCRRSLLSGEGAAEDVSIQSFLQDSLIEAFGRLADAIADLEACLGFEPMNEPHRGLVNLHSYHSWNYDTDLHIGHYPSFAQALALGSGYAQTVPYYVKSWPFPTRVSHQSLIDPKGRSAWFDEESVAVTDQPRGLGKCIWRAHGVWDWDQVKQTAVVLRDDYFDYDHRPEHQGRRIEWYRDCYAPFLQRFSQRVSRNLQKHFSFVGPLPNEFMPPWPSGSENTPEAAYRQQRYAARTNIPAELRPRNFVYAPHFYDLQVLFSKLHGWMSVDVQGLARGMFVFKALYFGATGLRKNYRKQISNIVRQGRASLGQTPIVIGEVGIPYDINGGSAFATGDYDKQRELMGALIGAMEDSLVDGFTLWHYNPDNRVEYGDGWNKEDFSVMTGDETMGEDGNGKLLRACSDYRNGLHEEDELYHRGRLLDVVIRPYAVKTAGEPTRSHWDHRTLRYEFEWRSKKMQTTAEKSRSTEIFIPRYHYGEHQVHVTVSGALDWSLDVEKQTLILLQHEVNDGDAPIHYKVVVDIRNLSMHLQRRVKERLQAFPRRFPFNFVPLFMEIWWEGVGVWRGLSGLLAVMVTALLVMGVAIHIRH
ncbi:glycoside hydrolase superfamily [Xylariales sp. AK1849]|nr:glycoside hydrolase superfamily [Xylariales sp. AK1849]